MKSEKDKKIKELRLPELRKIVQGHLPKVGFQLDSCEGNILVSDLEQILKYINNKGLIYDGFEFLNNRQELLRESVSYDVVSPGLCEQVTFQMLDTQHNSPSHYGVVGNIYTYDRKERQIRQLTFTDILAKL